MRPSPEIDLSTDPEHARRAAARRVERGAALEALVRAHYLPVHRLLQRLVGNPEDADDLAQECFVRAARHLPHGDALPWLRRVAVRLAIDHRRKRGRHAPPVGLEGLAVEPADERAPQPFDRLRARERERVLREALDALPERLRVPLVLRALEGLEHAEIAKLVGCRPATSRARVVEARRRLERSLRDRLGEGGVA